MAYVKRFPIGMLKIDLSFVRGVDSPLTRTRVKGWVEIAERNARPK